MYTHIKEVEPAKSLGGGLEGLTLSVEGVLAKGPMGVRVKLRQWRVARPLSKCFKGWSMWTWGEVMRNSLKAFRGFHAGGGEAVNRAGNKRSKKRKKKSPHVTVSVQ